MGNGSGGGKLWHTLKKRDILHQGDVQVFGSRVSVKGLLGVDEGDAVKLIKDPWRIPRDHDCRSESSFIRTRVRKFMIHNNISNVCFSYLSIPLLKYTIKPRDVLTEVTLVLPLI